MGKESTCSAGEAGSVPVSGRSSGGGHGSPLQYSCLENPMDRGACWAAVHGVTESDATEVTEHSTHMWDHDSLAGDRTRTPCIARWIPNHWTAREPCLFIFENPCWWRRIRKAGGRGGGAWWAGIHALWRQQAERWPALGVCCCYCSACYPWPRC